MKNRLYKRRLYRLCTRKDIDYINHDNISFIILARDGIYIDRC